MKTIFGVLKRNEARLIPANAFDVNPPPPRMQQLDLAGKELGDVNVCNRNDHIVKIMDGATNGPIIDRSWTPEELAKREAANGNERWGTESLHQEIREEREAAQSPVNHAFSP